ncbi:transcriptional regulator, TetR family [Pseudonocardia ammonioxydans]|uniref:Transcriptional regulator, TetR family n=2 Tax=Pseudonocardia ammonioxydans TaxID=260086 RepID=A0A1I5DZS5_PSUAM|nr:transcriptional regulator, TetR family [Pseudonocardia ammonioxydans]
MRADARLNRDRIVTVARRLVAERGPDVTTEEIARRADVGVATVYRHFPDRPALIREVALGGLRQVVTIARAAEDEEPDAWNALSRFVLRSATELRVATWLSLWFAGTWADLRADPETRRLRRILMTVLDRIVRRAQAEGHVRADIGSADVAVMLAALLRPVPGLPIDRPHDGGDRTLHLMLDGLRAAPHNSRLPDGGSTVAELLDPVER